MDGIRGLLVDAERRLLCMSDDRTEDFPPKMSRMFLKIRHLTRQEASVTANFSKTITNGPDIARIRHYTDQTLHGPDIIQTRHYTNKTLYESTPRDERRPEISKY